MMPAPCPPFKRLLSGYIENSKTGCWEWVGHKYQNGYGVLKVFGRDVSAHRYSYELHKGPVPEGMEILHSCDVRACINPSHLRAGTHSENMAEAAARGRMPSGEKHPLFGSRQPRPSMANPVRVLGKEYESQNAAERALGLGSGTVRYWLVRAPHKAQYLEKENTNGIS